MQYLEELERNTDISTLSHGHHRIEFLDMICHHAFTAYLPHCPSPPPSLIDQPMLHRVVWILHYAALCSSNAHDLISGIVAKQEAEAFLKRVLEAAKIHLRNTQVCEQHEKDMRLDSSISLLDDVCIRLEIVSSSLIKFPVDIVVSNSVQADAASLALEIQELLQDLAETKNRLELLLNDFVPDAQNEDNAAIDALSTALLRFDDNLAEYVEMYRVSLQAFVVDPCQQPSVETDVASHTAGELSHNVRASLDIFHTLLSGVSDIHNAIRCMHLSKQSLHDSLKLPQHNTINERSASALEDTASLLKKSVNLRASSKQHGDELSTLLYP